MVSAGSEGACRVACFTDCGYAWKSGGGSHIEAFFIVRSRVNDSFVFKARLEARCRIGIFDACAGTDLRLSSGTKSRGLEDSVSPSRTGLYLSSSSPSNGVGNASPATSMSDDFVLLKIPNSPSLEVFRFNCVGSVSMTAGTCLLALLFAFSCFS